LYFVVSVLPPTQRNRAVQSFSRWRNLAEYVRALLGHQRAQSIEHFCVMVIDRDHSKRRIELAFAMICVERVTGIEPAWAAWKADGRHQ